MAALQKTRMYIHHQNASHNQEIVQIQKIDHLRDEVEPPNSSLEPKPGEAEMILTMRTKGKLHGAPD